MGPYGSQNFKTLLLLEIEAESFQTSDFFFQLIVLTKLRLGFLQF